MKDSTQPPKYSLKKKEILRGKRAFEQLFEHGSTLRVGVLKFVFTYDFPPDQLESPLTVAFSAPKRNFKKAVHRNLLKRRMREAFRLNKHQLSDSLQRNHKNLVFLVTYTHRSVLAYEVIASAMKKGLEKFIRKTEKTEKE